MPKGKGTKDQPWTLKTPPGTSQFTAYRGESSDPPALVIQVGKTQLCYDLRCIDDLHTMLKSRGDWMPLGSADEQEPAAEGTVEAWGRSPKNPVGGWYGLKKGLRGRFAMYVPPVMEELGLAKAEHEPRPIACGQSDTPLPSVARLLAKITITSRAVSKVDVCSVTC